MRYKTNGLVSILSSLLIGCAAPQTALKGRIDIKYSDENYHYCYLPIGSTGYYIMGRGKNVIIAEFDAREKLDFINEVVRPTADDLEKADNSKIFDNTPHLMSYIIEPSEYEELKFIRIMKNIEESVSK